MNRQNWTTYRLQTVGKILEECGMPGEGRALQALDPIDACFKKFVSKVRRQIAPKTVGNTTLAIAMIVLTEILTEE